MIGVLCGEETMTMSSRFHKIPDCDGQTNGRTDRQTELLYQYCVSVC